MDLDVSKLLRLRLLGEQDVEFHVRQALGLRQAEVTPHQAQRGVPAQKKPVLPFQFHAAGLSIFGVMVLEANPTRLYAIRAMTTVLMRSRVDGISATRV